MTNINEILEDLDRAEPAGCPECQKTGGTETVAETFLYQGASRDLGEFIVHDARIWKCEACQTVRYSRSESRRWEEARRKGPAS